MPDSIDSILNNAATKPVIPLWPPNEPGIDPTATEEEQERGGYKNIRNPSLTVYTAPPETATGTAAVVCPGGGYGFVSCSNEGYNVATWLNTLGISAFVLKYRLPNTEGVNYRHPQPLRDVQRAIRMVRSAAGEYGIAPDRVGVVGFSAGGHLAATACTLYDPPVDADPVSCRPDFAILVYSVVSQCGRAAHVGSSQNLTGADPSPELIEKLTPDRNVTSDTPPMCLVHSRDDQGVPYDNSVFMHEALQRHGVESELHLYEQGGHGYGLGAPEHDCSQWPQVAAEWLRKLGLA